MSDRVAHLLARRARVYDAITARRRLLWSWGCQGAIWGVIVTDRYLYFAPLAMTPILLIASACVLAWSAVEGLLLQRALREPSTVWVLTFLTGLIPPAAPVLALVMLIESVGVLRIASRLRRDQCARCGYDLRGIDGAVCPECGWKTEDNPTVQ